MGARHLLGSLLAAYGLACGDSEPPERADAAPVADAAPAADAAVGVACRGASCAADQVCCRELLMPGAPAHYCTPDVTTCAGTPFACDGPEDCDEGQQCCSSGAGVECLPAGTCPEVVICHTAQDCPSGPCCDTPFGVVRACAGSC